MGEKRMSNVELRKVDFRWMEGYGKAAMGFEPMNNGFANRRLSPLGYAAKSLP
jgi:hypothetical protein